MIGFLKSYLQKSPDCIIVGAGRSGTSMLAGMLAHSGVNLGSDLHPANQWNPKGFFEDRGTTDINEQILQPYIGEGNQVQQLARRLQPGEAWLASFNSDFVPEVTPQIQSAIAMETAAHPLYRKDPRFCFTLPAWRPHFGRDTVFICIFRNPLHTAYSVRRFGQAYDLGISMEWALELWCDSYEIVLRRHSTQGRWIFVHYEQVLGGHSTRRLERALRIRLRPEFADATMQSPFAGGKLTPRAQSIYDELCTRASWVPLKPSESRETLS